MAAIGFVEVAATARVIQLGRPASAGTVLAVWAAGSVAGGLIYGSRDWPGRAASQLRVLLLLVAGGFAIVTAAQDMAWLYPLMFAAGLATAPAAAALTTSFSMASTTAARAGSFAWLASSSSLGGSAGYAAAGLLLTHATITTTILVGAALPVAAATAVPSPALTNGDRDSLVRLLPTGRFNRAGPESAEASGLSQSHSCSAEITLRVS